MTIEERANQAAQWKATGIYNCAQAVTQAFADQIPVEAETLKKLGAGYAAGMGCRYFDGRKRDAGGFQTAGGRFSGKMRCDNL